MIIALLLMILSGLGCSAVEPITVYKTETVYQDRYVAVPVGMVTPVEVVELSEHFDLPELGAGFKACVVRTQQANGKLAAIAGLALPEP